MEKKDLFYDIHTHSLNMNHPNLTLFLQRVLHSETVILETIFGTIQTEFKQLPEGVKKRLFNMFDNFGGFIKNWQHPIDIFKKHKKNRKRLKKLIEFLFDQSNRYKDGMVNWLKHLLSIDILIQNSKIASFLNALSVLDNDPGYIFLIMENCLAGEFGKKEPILKDGVIKIENKTYKKGILTPLIIDFNYNDRSEERKLLVKNIHYNNPPKKRLETQIIDMFSAIHHYQNESEKQFFEIYPFLGINTQNYTIEEIKNYLDLYFGDYSGVYTNCQKNFNNFYKKYPFNISKPTSDLFIGIKLYPPLGFDPWPDDEDEREKVKYLYRFCCEKNIPITTHCSVEGFTSTEDDDKFSSPKRWENVFKYSENGEYVFSKLKLNFAHFGAQRFSINNLISFKKDWRETILDMIKTYDNVYADISYYAVYLDYYTDLIKDIDKNSDSVEEREKILKRVMFGTDFSVNLFEIDSYNGYFSLFKESKISERVKDLFCNKNPESFLWNG